jgi:hypothetical protein
MSDPLVGWQKVWFFLRNNADKPLPVVTGSHPSLNPNVGSVWLRDASYQCFFALARYRVVKITCSYFEMVLQIMKNCKAQYSLSWFRPLL